MFFELMKSSILPYTSISLSIVLSLSDTEVLISHSIDYRDTVSRFMLCSLRIYGKSMNEKHSRGNTPLWRIYHLIQKVRNLVDCFDRLLILWNLAIQKESICYFTSMIIYCIGMGSVKVRMKCLFDSSVRERMVERICTCEYYGFV